MPATLQPATPRAVRWWREWEAWLLAALVLVIYLVRMTEIPICGEESRWAGAAREMIASGDWIVPRQQGQVFPERPPLGSWAMAAVGLIRGQVDAVAIRLPSVLAVLLTTLLVYGYARAFLSRTGALAAGLALATFGQVLQIGRLGESEALFMLLVGGSLLVWHWCYTRGWPAIVTWTLGYALAGLGALDKGPQAPVYFVAVTGAFLLWQRRAIPTWRLVSWSHAVGLLTFAAIVAAWQIPFYLATDVHTTRAIWSGLAADRFSLAGLAKHVVSYPLETIGCLLPWSPLLAIFLNRRFRQLLDRELPHVKFLVTAIAITYPTVWLASGARGRYYMPLYPCIAVLIGIVVDRCTMADAAVPWRRAWNRYLLAVAIVILSASTVLFAVSLADLESLAHFRQNAWFVSLFSAAAIATGALLLRQVMAAQPNPRMALILVACFLGLAYDGVAINLRLLGSNDLAVPVAELKQQLAVPRQLVSFGPIAHRFAYYYGSPIEELGWPESPRELPAGVTEFCFDSHPGDTAIIRANGRGRTWSTTPGTLPFEWDEIARIPCDPLTRDNADVTVIIGRIRTQAGAIGQRLNAADVR